MDLGKVLALLRDELESLNTAIATLERLQQGGRGRGRPPRLVPGHSERTALLTGKEPAKTEHRHP
jgi:prefoldin subunit 5